MVLLQLVNQLANPSVGGFQGGLKRRRLFIPPLTHHPLFSYGDGDQRLFLSLIEQLSTIAGDDDAASVASVSTTRSLPSTLLVADSDQELFQLWLVEEHERRFGDRLDAESAADDRYRGYGACERRLSVYSRQLALDDPHEDLTQPTTVGHEIRTLARYATPLVITFVLEHLFLLVALLVVGRLGKNELAAVLLATMTTTISFGIFEGMATALDTLCPQAYGAGQYELVSLRVQRLTVLGWCIFVPVAVFWWYSDYVFQYVIDSKAVVKLTCQFLRIMVAAGPAVVFFENGKRFLQAQGIFEASTGILFVCAPINAIALWYLVWNPTHGLGYIGAPIVAVGNFWLMLILLVLYVKFVDGKECWFGLALVHQLFEEWGVILRLAIPGVVMLELEYLAYEIMTLFALMFGTTELAAQLAVALIVLVTYMAPFATGIAALTRVANFIGAENAAAAKMATKVAMAASVVVGVIDCIGLITFRHRIADLFTRDPEVAALIVQLLYPLVPMFEIFDLIALVLSGILRAQGAQKIGGIVNFMAYYMFGLPLAFILSKTTDIGLEGLWIGVGLGMVVIGLIQLWYIGRSDWDQIIICAELLNEFDDDDDD